ncbi:MAG: PAS domain S-box protein [Candidatus Muirbacterium halophilum]|nr:PAS domain S-box protein [Candidatus Muirbacterium halophilum]
MNIKNFKKKYEQITSNIDAGIAIHKMLYDKDKKARDYEFLELNETFTKMTGLDKDAIGKTVLEVFPNTENYWIETYDKVVKTQKTISYSNYSKEIDAWYEVIAFCNAPGEFTTIIKDISIRKKMERDILESRNTLDLVLDATETGFFDFNPTTGNINYLSEKIFEMLGYEKAYKISNLTDFLNLIFIDDLFYVQKLFYEYLKNKDLDKTFQIEVRVLGKNGKYHWIMSRGKVVEWDNAGNASRMVGIHIDINEKKQIEKKLDESRNFLREIIDSMPLSLIVTDKNGKIIEINSKASKECNLDINDKNLDIFESIEILKNNKDIILKLFRENKNNIFRTNLFHEEQAFFYDIIFYPLSNTIKKAVLIIEDVTSKVKIEEILIQSEKMLSVGGLAAGMAHEINNPLSGILQSIQNIERRIFINEKNLKVANEIGVNLDKINEYFKARKIDIMLNGIKESGEKAAEIVHDMLSFSRHPETKMKQCKLTDIIEKSIKLANNDYDLKKNYDFRKIKIVRDYSDENIEIVGNCNEIEQVILNIFRNSTHAMTQCLVKNPEIVIKIFSDFKYNYISFKDNGSGIDDKIKKRIFEPFFTTKPPGEGTGLGLSVSYFIITQNHKGIMKAESYKNKGTLITIGFPKKIKNPPEF